jgi:hypothetical protein
MEIQFVHPPETIMRIPFGKRPTAGLSKNSIPGLKRNIHLGRIVCPDAIIIASSKNPIPMPA